MNTRISVEIKVRIWKGDNAKEGRPDRPCDMQASASAGRCNHTESKAQIADLTASMITEITNAITAKINQNTDANRN